MSEQHMGAATSYVAPRTCTVVDESERERVAGKSTALIDHAGAAAYVLIAEPGAGKTTAFRNEAAGEGAVYVTVRDFRTFDDDPEWHGVTLFLDGLDESRAGTEDGRTPLDEVRRKLDGLGRPRFRLSCRWADWLAANDKEGLEKVSPDGSVVVVRLDPLSERDIKDILVKNHRVEDGDGFIAAARKRGVDRLLRNPQNLDLLAKSVAEGKWPDSRRETFENACRMLARETNGEHRAANPATADTESLIEAAGRLCAVQLLSGGAGYTLPDRAEPKADYPSVAEVDGDPRRGPWQVLGTRLFEGVSEGRLAPAHRQIAEFLAARHVSGLLDAGLPLERVLALITGSDGGLLAAFQNFVSWLAVHNKASRKRLSRFDASGLIYAGERDTYSADEKREIVRNLRRETAWNPWCSRSMGKVSGIGAIVSAELEGMFLEILSDPERDHEHQSYVMLLMQLLTDGEPLPALACVLEETVRDPSWGHGVRCAALDVLTGYAVQDRLGFDALAGMAAEIHEGRLDDPQDELLGILLKALYPEVLLVAEALRYLRAPKLVETGGEYSRFWVNHVPRESAPEQLADLLDGIVARFEDFRPFMVRRVALYTRMGNLPVELLKQIFRDKDAEIAPDRMYDWLGVVSDPGLGLPERERSLVGFDLRWNQDALKALIVRGVERSLENGEDCLGLVDRRLFGARPFDYAPWCLEMALGAEDGRAASFYLGELLDSVAEGSGARGLTVESVRAELADNEPLLNRFEAVVRRREGPGTPREVSAEGASLADAQEEDSREDMAAAWNAALRATPEALHRVAEAYLGNREDAAGNTPRDRLGSLVGGSEELVDVLVAALEEAVGGEDLPGGDDVVRLADRDRVDWRVLPFAAGLHSLERSGRLAVGNLEDWQIRLAVTILYTLPRRLVDPDSTDGAGIYRPEWFRALLRDDPALVADVVCRTAARKLASGVRQARELRELADVDDHREVAALAALPVLKRFPRADTAASLVSLCWALHAALERCGQADVDRVIVERLERGGQPAGERACWVSAGYFTAPDRYGADIRALADDDEGLTWLVMFVELASVPRSDVWRSLSASDIEPLVAALGAAYRRNILTNRAFWFVAELIAKFGDDTSRSAGEALAALEEKPEAAPWLPAIRDARGRQAGKRREDEYRHCDIGSVLETLADRRPANPSDLAALVFDELKGLARRTRDGNTSDWRQHWNVDGYRRPTDPRPEDACRDALLSDLELRLARLGIDAQPEGVYAEDKRADIRVSFAGFNVPVEIKRSCHDDLWSAVGEQLIAKYTRDPGAAGFGIYLVLWFGDTEMCRPTKHGDWSPETAEDVRRRLEESLPEEERWLISICVVDVSIPPERRTAAA